jgi:uncharacterized C2H2 Zn-finger protein
VGQLVVGDCSPLVGQLKVGDCSPLVGQLVVGDCSPLVGQFVVGDCSPLVGQLVVVFTLKGPFSTDFGNNLIFSRLNEKEIRCPRNPIFWKNRISQTMPKVPKKSDFFGKIGFLKPCPRCPRNFLEKSDFSNRAQGAQEIFWKNRISQTVPKAPKKSDFLDLARISFEIQWSGNFRFRALPL